MSVAEVLENIKRNETKFVDLRFTDTLGKEQHVTLPADIVDEDLFTHGKMFDGSSIAGWKEIHESDMMLLPDPDSGIIDPFIEETTLHLRCDVVNPDTKIGYELGPRSLAKRAERYLRESGIGDQAWFGPEPEFFLFDHVTWHDQMGSSHYLVDAKEAAWNSKRSYKKQNSGHRPKVKGGYFPVPPVDSGQNIRSDMVRAMQEMGLKVEVHHHEVGTAGQSEIGTAANTLVIKADEVQILKYCVHNVANDYGKTATFMPKPLVGDNGSGMHVHQSISKDGRNIFVGDKYANLSQEALWYIGGIFKHARALNAFANAGTNSYKRLVPGFEAPNLLVYSACNRSASIRIPYDSKPQGRRVEVRFPDGTANPYLCFASMLMAGLDGIQNKIDPGDPIDKDLYHLPEEELKNIPTVCASLNQALIALDSDRDFLKKNGVFTDHVIDAYIALKMRDVIRLNASTHPLEFEMYYSV